MKLISLLKNLIKMFFVLLLSLLIFPSNNVKAFDIAMNKINENIVEELRLNVPLKYKETWLRAEKDVWEPWLAKQNGFLGRKIFYNQKTGEALLLVKWENRNLWKNISDEEVNKMQKIYEETVISSLDVDTNPFEFIYEGELFEQQ
mgnify:CR=1 FL=1|tara:strand:- start:258 stop:695 length:438 start_codon:yes stop_codon:yes gene_type:complete